MFRRKPVQNWVPKEGPTPAPTKDHAVDVIDLCKDVDLFSNSEKFNSAKLEDAFKNLKVSTQISSFLLNLLKDIALREYKAKATENEVNRWSRIVRNWVELTENSESEVDFAFKLLTMDTNEDELKFGGVKVLLNAVRQNGLKAVMALPVLEKGFHDFIVSRHCQESYDCLRIIQDKLTERPFNLTGEWLNELTETFLKAGSQNEVNISHELRQKLLTIDLKDEDVPGVISLLQRLKEELYNLLTLDAFREFEHSEAFLEKSALNLWEELHLPRERGITLVQFKRWSRKYPALLDSFLGSLNASRRLVKVQAA